MSSAESTAADPGAGPVGPGIARERAFWTIPAALALGLAGALALLRFASIGAWSLWVDEAHTLHDALVPSAAWGGYPLGYLVTRAAIALRGGAVDEGTLRLGPAVFGALAIPLTFWAFVPAVGRRRAVVAALVVAASGWHLYWSQTARAYTLMQDLSLLGAGVYLRGLRSGGYVSIVLGIALGALAVFAHPSAALLLPAWVLAPLVLPVFGARLPVAPPRGLLIGLGTLGVVVFGSWALGVWRSYEIAKSGGNPLHFVLTTGFYVTPAVAAGAGVGALVGLGRRRAFDVLATLVCLVVALAAFGAATRVRMSAQYVFVLLPWVAALATAPLDLGVLRSRAALRGVWVALLVVPGLVDCALYYGWRHGNRPRWREAYAHVWNERGPDDLVFGMAAPVGEYYLSPRRRVLRQHRSLVRLNHYTSLRPGHWLRRGRRIWFVVREEDLAPWEPSERADFEALLASECRLELELPIELTPRDLTVRVYVREPDGVP